MNDIGQGVSAPVAAGSQRAVPLWVIVLAGAAIAGIGMGLRQVMGLYL
jgi:hypothetical protein